MQCILWVAKCKALLKQRLQSWYTRISNSNFFFEDYQCKISKHFPDKDFRTDIPKFITQKLSLRITFVKLTILTKYKQVKGKCIPAVSNGWQAESVQVSAWIYWHNAMIYVIRFSSSFPEFRTDRIECDSPNIEKL